MSCDKTSKKKCRLQVPNVCRDMGACAKITKNKLLYEKMIFFVLFKKTKAMRLMNFLFSSSFMQSGQQQQKKSKMFSHL